MGRLSKLKDGVEHLLDMRQEARLQRAREQGFDTDTVYYHGTDKDFDAFDPSAQGSATDEGWYGEGFYFSPHASTADAYSMSGFDLDNGAIYKDGANIQPVYLRDAEKIKNKHGSIVEAVVRDPSNIRSVNAAFDPAKKDSANLLASAAPIGIGLGAMAQGEDAEAGVISKGGKVLLGDLPRDMREELFNEHAMNLNPEATERSFYRNRVPSGTMNISDVQVDTIPESQLDYMMSADITDLPPLVVSDGRLIDGQHRINVARQKGVRDLPYIDVSGLIDTDVGGFISQLPKSAGVTSAIGGLGLLGSTLSPEASAMVADARLNDTVTGSQAIPEEQPVLDRIGRALYKVDTPIGRPFEGISNYLMKLGEPISDEQRNKVVLNALFDLI